MMGLLLRGSAGRRTTRRDDPRLLGEFSLVVLTMLFVSERSWKHHFVTVLAAVHLPDAYRVGVDAKVAPRVRVTLVSGRCWRSRPLLMATTSSELGGLFAKHRGHKIAQGYGMFLWSGVVLLRRDGLEGPSRAGDSTRAGVGIEHLTGSAVAALPVESPGPSCRALIPVPHEVDSVPRRAAVRIET